MGRRLYRQLRAPLSVQVEITAQCNQVCGHCYNYWRRSPGLEGDISSSDSMSIDTASRVAEECAKNEIFAITITGGEPLMNQPVIELLASFAARHGIYVGLNSNLSLVKAKEAEWLRSVGVRGVLTSLLGPTSDVHDSISGKNGSFERTIEGIEACIKSGISVAANMVACQQNYTRVRQTAQLAKKIGCRWFSLTPAVRPVNCHDFSSRQLSAQSVIGCFADLLWAHQALGIEVDTLVPPPYCALDMKEIITPLLQRNCGAGVTFAMIACDGGLRPCPHSPDVYGNAVMEGIAPVWERMDDWRTGERIPAECLKCSLLKRCGGGCRFSALMASNGQKDARDPLMNANNVPLVERRLNELSIGSDQLSSIASKFANPTSHRLRFARFRLRQESFGGVIALGRKFTFLNCDGYEILKGIVPGQLYLMTELVNSETKRVFFEGLAAKEFLSVD